MIRIDLCFCVAYVRCLGFRNEAQLVANMESRSQVWPYPLTVGATLALPMLSIHRLAQVSCEHSESERVAARVVDVAKCTKKSVGVDNIIMGRHK